MKQLLLLFITLFLFALTPRHYLYSQEYNWDNDCCDEYYLEDTTILNMENWEKQMSEQMKMVDNLRSELNLIDTEIESLRILSLSRDKDIADAELDLYTAIGSNKAEVDDFRIKFKECEKRIMNCKNAETAELIRKSCFDEIEASRIKCLPEFWERYLIMKKRLEECSEKEPIEEKSGNYTVVKGDCLWKIAGKREIYGNSRFWPKIWEANKNGVISAPARIPKTIKNPNLIYPGQVLRIPVLSEVEMKMESNKTKEIKKTRKKKP